MSRPPAPRTRDARTCTASGRTRLASIPRAVGVSLQRRVEAGQTAGRVGERPRTACYNPGRSMLGRDWALLVTGTLLGVVSLTADLVGLGAFPGFGWKQVVGTTAALGDRDSGRAGASTRRRGRTAREPAGRGRSGAAGRTADARGAPVRERGRLATAPHHEPDAGPRQPPPRVTQGRPDRARAGSRRDANARVHAALLDPVPHPHPPSAGPHRGSPRHQAGRQDRAPEGMVASPRRSARRRRGAGATREGPAARAEPRGHAPDPEQPLFPGF